MTRVRVQAFETAGSTGQVWIRDTVSADGGAYGTVSGSGVSQSELDTILDGYVLATDLDGGSTGEVLTKLSNADGDYDWQAASGGSGLADSHVMARQIWGW
jgi:hypothetical protein